MMGVNQIDYPKLKTTSSAILNWNLLLRIGCARSN